MLIISPFAKANYVDSQLTDQTSILRFIEDNWLSGTRIGNGSFDALAGPLTSMLDFDHHNNGKLILDPTTGIPTEE
jgi:phospholipase C